MEPRPLGNPGELLDCAADLRRLSQDANGLASQSSDAVKDPGFSGLGAVHYNLGGVAAAMPLRQQAAALAALAAEVVAAAEKLRADQLAWDRRAEAERRRIADESERRRRGAGPADYRNQL